MRCYILVIIILVLINGVINLIGGCGDSGTSVPAVTPSPSVLPSGTFSVSVNIPARKTEKVIPWNSKTLRVIITGSSIPTPLEGKAEIPSSGTVTLNMTNVPVGTNVATIDILDPNGILVARRKQGFYMGSNATAKAENVSMGIGINPDGGLHCDPNVIEIKGGETLFFENQDLAGHSVKVNNTTINIYGVKDGNDVNQPSVYGSGSIFFDVYGTYDILIGDYGVDPITPYGKIIVYKPLNPVISSFTPDIGTTGTSVKIYGTDFSDKPSDNIVKFNGIQAVVSSVSTGYLIASAPSGVTSGPISISVRNSPVSISSEKFTVSDIARLSISSAGVEGNLDSSNPSVSGDGRYTAFESQSNNLVSGDTNGVSDVFVRDRTSGITSRISVDLYGVQGNDMSGNPSITPDGRFVEFESEATNFVSGSIYGWNNIFHRDLINPVLIRVSTDIYGDDGNGSSTKPSVSNDGLLVAFESVATNLYVPYDINAFSDIFLRDLGGTMTRVTWDVYMLDPDGNSNEPHISGNGRYVTFSSDARELVYGDTNLCKDVFIWDNTATGNKIARISINTAGVQGNNDSGSPSITPDGRYVAFVSMADNLVAGDTNGVQDVFIRDRVAGTTTIVSVSSSGVVGDNSSMSPVSISSDGQRVIFSSNATNLVAGDTNGFSDIFLRDIQAGKTIRISVNKDGLQADLSSLSPVFALNSPIIVFTSYATNLVSPDAGGVSDIYMRIFYP